MRKKETIQIYQILNKTFKDIALTFAGIALENNFKDETITEIQSQTYEVELGNIKIICKIIIHTKICDHELISTPGWKHISL